MTKLKVIFILGGAGYIGSHITKILSENDYLPIVIDNFSNSIKSISAKIESLCKVKPQFYNVDCTNLDDLSKTIIPYTDSNKYEIFGMIHLAAFKSVNESILKPLEYYENNLNSLQVALKVCKLFSIESFVFSSSCTVYGTPNKLPVTEKENFGKSESAYSRSKQFSEAILDDFFNAAEFRFKVAALRYFNPIGADTSGKIGELPLGTPNNVVPVLMDSIKNGTTFKVFGDDYPTKDGSCVRDYIHVLDLAEAHLKTLEYLSALTGNNKVEINIGTGQGTSVLELISIVKEEIPKPLNYKIEERRAGDIAEIYAHTGYSLDLLKWKPKFTVRDALKHSWDWVNSDHYHRLISDND